MERHKGHKESLRVFFCFVFLVFNLAMPFALMAQPEVEATITPKEILIGAPATLTLQIKHQPDVNIFWPNIPAELPVDSARNIEVLQVSKLDTLRAGGYVQENMVLQVTAWDTGFYIIPSFSFSYNTATDTTLQVIQNYPVLLQVNTVPVDTSQAIRPIKAPLDAPFSIWEYKKWIVLGVILVHLLALVIYLLIKKKNKVVEVIVPKVVKAPHELAMEKLQTLEAQKLWQQGDVKAYYSGLSDIMREYLEARFHFPAVESTTYEICASLDQTQLPPTHREQLKEMFTLSDLAKFAKVQPLPDDHFRAMQSAKEFVKATRPIETEKKDV